MGIPFGCKIGKHSWTSANADGVKTCKFCRKISDPKPTRCKADIHTWGKNDKGIKVCKFCKKDYSIWKVHSLWYGTAGHGIHDGDGGE